MTSRTTIIQTTNIIHADDILDLLNGKNMFWLENPYFQDKSLPVCNNKLFSFTEMGVGKGAGKKLNTSRLFYKKDSTWISNTDYRIDVCNGKYKPMKFLKPYSADGKESQTNKSINKFLVNIGSPDSTDNKSILTFNHQIAQAMDYLILAKILDIDLKNYTNSYDLITDMKMEIKTMSKIKQNSKQYKLSADDKGDISEYVDNILDHKFDVVKSGIININVVGDSNTTSPLFEGLNQYFNQLKIFVKTNPKYGAKVLVDYVGDNKHGIESLVPCKKTIAAKYIEFTNKATEELETQTVVGGALTFVTVTGNNNERYCTKIVSGTKITPLTTDYYRLISADRQNRKNVKMVLSFDLDFRKYGDQTTPAAATKFEVKQMCVTSCGAVDEEILLMDDDEPGGDAVTIDTIDDADEVLL